MNGPANLGIDHFFALIFSASCHNQPPEVDFMFKQFFAFVDVGYSLNSLKGVIQGII